VVRGVLGQRGGWLWLTAGGTFASTRRVCRAELCKAVVLVHGALCGKAFVCTRETRGGAANVFHQASTVLQGKRARVACVHRRCCCIVLAPSLGEADPFFFHSARPLAPQQAQAPGAHLRCSACV